MEEGSKFFDDERKFKSYQSKRHRAESPNESIEKPIFLEMLGDVKGKQILDLGCGDGTFGLELLRAGCQSYLGVEASLQIVQAAQKAFQQSIGQVVHAKIEDWIYPVNHFNLVISRLALHYVATLDDTFNKVNSALKSGGRFVFSIVHPVITSCDRSRKGGGARQDWIVDDYFATGSRQVYFMGEYVEQYHRTIEDIYKALRDADFFIEQLRESRPKLEHFTDITLYERRMRIPLFLLFSGRKK
jgi:SAM-dependent methyltransferase